MTLQELTASVETQADKNLMRIYHLKSQNLSDVQFFKTIIQDVDPLLVKEKIYHY